MAGPNIVPVALLAGAAYFLTRNKGGAAGNVTAISTAADWEKLEGHKRGFVYLTTGGEFGRFVDGAVQSVASQHPDLDFFVIHISLVIENLAAGAGAQLTPEALAKAIEELEAMSLAVLAYGDWYANVVNALEIYNPETPPQPPGPMSHALESAFSQGNMGVPVNLQVVEVTPGSSDKELVALINGIITPAAEAKTRSSSSPSAAHLGDALVSAVAGVL
jgi:hypothetical protein